MPCVSARSCVSASSFRRPGLQRGPVCSHTLSSAISIAVLPSPDPRRRRQPPARLVVPESAELPRIFATCSMPRLAPDLVGYGTGAWRVAAMGMHLMRVYDPIPPGFWCPRGGDGGAGVAFRWFGGCSLAARARVTGSPLHHQLTPRQLLSPSSNDTGFGGNNGLHRLVNVQADGTRAVLFAAIALGLPDFLRSSRPSFRGGDPDAESRTVATKTFNSWRDAVGALYAPGSASTRVNSRRHLDRGNAASAGTR